MNIALLAHDNKKKLMENLCLAYRSCLSKHVLFATGTTGLLVERNVGLSVSKHLAGHLGGERQIGAQIAHNQIDLVIFLRDPNNPKYYEQETNSVLELCDVRNIPIATNLATAEALLQALDRGDLDWRYFVSE